MLISPKALLLDFVGVVMEVPTSPKVSPAFSNRLAACGGNAMSVERMLEDVRSGGLAYRRWRDRAGAEDRPVELTHQQVWSSFIAADWPEPVRHAALADATRLSYLLGNTDWTVRQGIPLLLDATTQLGLPVAIVSNALCGAVHRDALQSAGLANRVTTQLYSDEVGVRKPNPEMAWLAAAALRVPVESCWFVGDSLLRDVECARRAGAGASILMRSSRTADDEASTKTPAESGPSPDAVVSDGNDLAALLRSVELAS